MRHHRQSTRHTALFFTRDLPEFGTETHILQLTISLAFFPPKNAVYYVIFWKMNTTFLEALIQYGADIHRTPYRIYNSPIRELFSFEATPYRIQAIKILLRAGADTTDILEARFVLTTLMTVFNDDDCILFFEGGRGGCFGTALILAVEHRRLGLIPYLISLGANPRCCNDSLIWMAACIHRLDIIKLLLAGGAIVTDRVLKETIRHSDDSIHRFLLQERHRHTLITLCTPSSCNC